MGLVSMKPMLRIARDNGYLATIIGLQLLFLFIFNCISSNADITAQIDSEKFITVKIPNIPTNAKPLDLVLIEPGVFNMGSPTNDEARESDEDSHRVSITDAFYLGVYEITQAQFKQIMGYNPSKYSNHLNHPVEQISWFECQNFIYELNRLNVETFRLPTEAEWEYACRAGTKTRFSFGDSLECSNEIYCATFDQYMWWNKNQHIPGTTYQTREVGLKLPNPWGLYDMHGNVSEWCQDRYYEKYRHLSGHNPLGLIKDGFYPINYSVLNFVVRGGSWNDYALNCRSAKRESKPPDFNSWPSIGFRIARNYIKPIPPLPDHSPIVEEKILIQIPNLPPNAKPLEMVKIPAGTFIMGSPNNEKGRFLETEWLPHQVRITDDFYIGKFEVTQAQWQSIMDASPSQIKDNLNQPICRVTWLECQDFIKRLNELKLSDMKFALPTEAQWEYACRADTTSRYSFGDAFDCNNEANCNSCEIMDSYMWYCGNSDNTTHEVGLKLPNNWGLYDMHGNAGEWCLDDGGEPYKRTFEINPVNSDPFYSKVIRGGTAFSQPWLNRSSSRNSLDPRNKANPVGLRLILTKSYISN